VYLSGRPLPGAVDAVATLRQNEIGVVFVSNNPTVDADRYAHRLSALGIPTEPQHVLTSGGVTAGWLREHHPDAKLLLVSEPSLRAELAAAGCRLAEAPEDADVVVVSFDRTFDYAKWTAAFTALRRGALFVATNPDATCPVEGGAIPDSAGINAAQQALCPVVVAPTCPVEYAALQKQVEPWTRADVVYVASLVGGIFGRGGGAEASNAAWLQALTAKLGRAEARRVYDDLRGRLGLGVVGRAQLALVHREVAGGVADELGQAGLPGVAQDVHQEHPVLDGGVPGAVLDVGEGGALDEGDAVPVADDGEARSRRGGALGVDRGEAGVLVEVVEVGAVEGGRVLGRQGVVGLELVGDVAGGAGGRGGAAAQGRDVERRGVAVRARRLFVAHLRCAGPPRSGGGAGAVGGGRGDVRRTRPEQGEPGGERGQGGDERGGAPASHGAPRDGGCDDGHNEPGGGGSRSVC
jgi:hypothetical protein